jgi:hypothetical protein
MTIVILTVTRVLVTRDDTEPNYNPFSEERIGVSFAIRYNTRRGIHYRVNAFYAYAIKIAHIRMAIEQKQKQQQQQQQRRLRNSKIEGTDTSNDEPIRATMKR